MRPRSLILETTVRLAFDAALVLSIYLLFAGHNQPGGGFTGGLVAAAAFALRFLTGGLEELHAATPIRPTTCLSIGLLLATASAIVPLATGAAPLDQRVFESTLPLIGNVTLTTATVFDTGVYLIVVGLLLMILDGLGGER